MRPLLLVAAALAGVAAAASAQESLPTKPVRIAVNFAPGGSTDNAARPFADRLTTVATHALGRAARSPTYRTPSFFCRLELEVVYWNSSFLSG